MKGEELRFRKKPIVIEAVQFFEAADLPAGVTIFCESRPLAAGQCSSQGVPHVHTLEGPLMVSDGDWIITGVAGERYPCKPDIFKTTYDPTE